MVTTGPTIGGFLAFIRNVMGIDSTVLPNNEPIIVTAYEIALEIVNLALKTASPTMYELAVYNLGGDNLINYAPDQPGSTYFSSLRDDWNIYKFIPGVIQSSTDVSTSQTLLLQQAFKNITVANLQNLKTPYGRTYIGIAQRYGPTIWGVS